MLWNSCFNLLTVMNCVCICMDVYGCVMEFVWIVYGCVMDVVRIAVGGPRRWKEMLQQR